MIALLHHHPIPVRRPEWYAEPFYEKIFGKWFAKTVELRDAKTFRKFIEDRNFDAVLHGHEHIPRFDKLETKGPREIAVVGCGSSVGKVPTNNGGIYISLNIITINRATSQMTARLAAQKIVGGKLDMSNELLM